jgi:hypothetical protein
MPLPEDDLAAALGSAIDERQATPQAHEVTRPQER